MGDLISFALQLPRAKKRLSHAFLPLVEALELDGLKAWIDHSDVRFGVLLRNELQSAIRNCRVLVLLWSRAASISRWVMAEMLTAFHCDRFIIPCVLDRTQLPQFLQNTAYLDRRRDKANIGQKLCRAIRAAPKHANEVPVFMASESTDVKAVIETVAKGQEVETGALLQRDLTKAAEAHAAAGAAVAVFEKSFPFEPRFSAWPATTARTPTWPSTGMQSREDRLRRIRSWKMLNAFSLRFSASNRWIRPR